MKGLGWVIGGTLALAAVGVGGVAFAASRPKKDAGKAAPPPPYSGFVLKADTPFPALGSDFTLSTDALVEQTGQFWSLGDLVRWLDKQYNAFPEYRNGVAIVGAPRGSVQGGVIVTGAPSAAHLRVVGLYRKPDAPGDYLDGLVS